MRDYPDTPCWPCVKGDHDRCEERRYCPCDHPTCPKEYDQMNTLHVTPANEHHELSKDCPCNPTVTKIEPPLAIKAHCPSCGAGLEVEVPPIAQVTHDEGGVLWFEFNHGRADHECGER